MNESFIFTGTGFVLGNYEVTNEEILKYIRLGYLEGFLEERAAKSDKYQEYKKLNPLATPFDYMVESKMGFKKRYHVVPFPPTKFQYEKASTTLDLCVAAIEKALTNANLSGNDIDAWFAGTATFNQKAPGIAEFAKSYFTSEDNQSPTFSTTSACVGFNVNLEAAMAYFHSHKEAKHIVIAHAEVMSKLLLEERDFVPYSTFGDSAAAVVLSRVSTSEKCGIISVFNGEDTAMLDFLGADKKGNLFMDPRMVKIRAVSNITSIAEKILADANWTIADLSLFIPHQTGDAIVHNVAKNLNIDLSKVFQKIQINYGNLSGASIPACFDYLMRKNSLPENSKVIAAVAGLGGEFGGFSYIVPNEKFSFTPSPELSGKTLMITGATGGIGRQIAKLAARKGARLILVYNSNDLVISDLANFISKNYQTEVTVIKADLSESSDLEKVKKIVEEKYSKINYLINTHAVTGSLSRATNVEIHEFKTVLSVNYESIKNLCVAMRNLISEAVLITGSVGEDAQFAGSSSYVASKRALRAFARNYATELYKDDVKCVYYLPGIINAGMIAKLDESQKMASVMSVGQKKLTEVDEIAERMLLSVCRLKIPNVRISFESNLAVIKDVYKKF